MHVLILLLIYGYFGKFYILFISIIMDMTQNEVRVTLPKEMKDRLVQRAKSLGIKPTEYIRSLVIEDFKKDIGKGK